MKSLRFLALLLLACLLLVPQARADDALARVKAKGELVIATDATYPPFEFKGADDEVVGFDREVGDALGKALGVKVRWLPMEWAGVFPALETGKCDLVMSGVTITDERRKTYAFMRPYFLSGQVVVRKKGDVWDKPESLLGGSATVAVQLETTGQFAMEKRGLSKDRIHRFDTLQDALLDVRNGKSTAAVGDLPAVREIIRKGYPELELAPSGVFVEENLGIVARKDARDLVAALNTALDRILVDGTYARIFEKWMLEPLTGAIVGRLDTVKGQGTPIPPDILAAVASGDAAKAKVGGDDTPASGSAFAIRGDILRNALPQLLRGAILTVELTILTILLGVPLGLGVALCRMASFAPLRTVATVYIEAVRGTPLLMQIYVIYFVLPGLGVSLPPFWAGVMALSLNAAAYVAEIFRAGIESIDIGQREAARALGMSGTTAMRFVILPQTIRRVLPPLTNEAVALLKDSSLVSVVALTELMRVGKEIATNAGSPTTIYLAVALIYLALTLPLTALVRRLELRFAFERRKK